MRPLSPAEKNGELNLLLQTIAHDLRNPLSTIHHLAYLMEHRYDPKHVEQLKEQLNLCDAIVANMLALGGLRPSEPQTVSAAQIARDAARYILLPERIQLVIEDSPIQVCVDGSQLVQLMVNLFRNSAEAIGNGPGEISMTFSSVEPVACLQLTDTGGGFPVSVLEGGLRPIRSTKKNGLGLGLAAAAWIAEANQGRIELKNAPEGRAVCSIYLPLA